LEYSNIVPMAEEYVEGVLYLLTEQALSSLDKYEGFPEHYDRKHVMVWNIDQCRWVNAEAYVAVKTDNTLKPSRDYLEEIVEAAKTMGLSQDWISKLESMLPEDENPQQRKKNS